MCVGVFEDEGNTVNVGTGELFGEELVICVVDCVSFTDTCRVIRTAGETFTKVVGTNGEVMVDIVCIRVLVESGNTVETKLVKLFGEAVVGGSVVNKVADDMCTAVLESVGVSTVVTAFEKPLGVEVGIIEVETEGDEDRDKVSVGLAVMIGEELDEAETLEYIVEVVNRISAVRSVSESHTYSN